MGQRRMLGATHDPFAGRFSVFRAVPGVLAGCFGACWKEGFQGAKFDPWLWGRGDLLSRMLDFGHLPLSPAGPAFFARKKGLAGIHFFKMRNVPTSP